MTFSGVALIPAEASGFPPALSDYAMSRRDPRSTGESAVNGAQRHRKFPCLRFICKINICHRMPMYNLVSFLI
jgi:hypothetical protein